MPDVKTEAKEYASTGWFSSEFHLPVENINCAYSFECRDTQDRCVNFSRATTHMQAMTQQAGAKSLPTSGASTCCPLAASVQ